MSLIKPLTLKEAEAVNFLCRSALLVFFISDACNKLLLYLAFDFYRVSIFFRSFYEILFLAIIALYINEVRLLFLKIFLFLFSLFIAGQLMFAFNVDYVSYNYLENITSFNKYFFVFIVYFAIYKLPKHPDNFNGTIKIMENIFLVNSIATVVGFLFQIKWLRTYVYITYKDGYSGFIPAQNEATYFFLIVVSYFYYRHFILNEKSYKFYLILGSSLLVGTKGIYLFLAMLLLFHFLHFSTLKAKAIATTLIATIVIGGYFYLQTNHSKVLLEYFISRKDKHGWFSMLLSGRDKFIIDKGLAILEDWNILNYFTGGQDQTRLFIEMDFFDLFLFLGPIGGTIVLILYLSSLFKFNKLKPFNFFFVLSFFTLAFLGGHFFYSAVNALYICLFSMYLYASQKNEPESA